MAPFKTMAEVKHEVKTNSSHPGSENLPRSSNTVPTTTPKTNPGAKLAGQRPLGIKNAG
jgi:hypothetical protein